MPKTRNHALARLLKEAGLSNGELARAVNRLGALQGSHYRYDRTSVAHWLTGSLPRPPVPDLVAQHLSGRLHRLVLPAQTGLLREAPANATTVRAADELLYTLGAAEEDGEKRAALLRLPWSCCPQLSAAQHKPPAGRLQTGPRELRSADLAALDFYLTHFGCLFERHGSGPARTALRAFATTEGVSYLTSRAPQRSRRAVQHTLGRLVHLLATATFDAGHLGLAQRYHRAALSLADEAQDADLRAIVLRSMSNQARSVGFVPDAEHLAEAARADESRLTPATRAFLLTGRAAVLAASGRTRALHLLDTAQELLHGSDTGTDPYTDYSQAAFEYQRGEVLLLLGHRQDGIAALTASLEHRPREHHRTRALTSCALAVAQLRIGHAEAACGSWRAALTEEADVASPRLQRLLKSLHQQSHPYRNHAHVSALRRQTAALP
ncbi:hypothetical protein [Streptomyces sp. NPDC046939]|uniref:hypothetical protein n=1 Tax=Streptomyces sp. NPDC046939 TaxID=3155376 RepID=UPI003407D787